MCFFGGIAVVLLGEGAHPLGCLTWLPKGSKCHHSPDIEPSATLQQALKAQVYLLSNYITSVKPKGSVQENGTYMGMQQSAHNLPM